MTPFHKQFFLFKKKLQKSLEKIAPESNLTDQEKKIGLLKMKSVMNYLWSSFMTSSLTDQEKKSGFSVPKSTGQDEFFPLSHPPSFQLLFHF